ncbi:MAG TPA: CBS domain-containing protein, partial [Crocinitomicaceae bacterium]|nr:CBS domain-containing protein [Crocinitomicaceae bacterium]
DGGVNGEVSFILRNMGVSSAVSGSYLFKAPSVGQALLNLTNRNIESEFLVADFMMPLDECPMVFVEDLTLKSTLEEIENGQLGFTLVTDKKQQFHGIISNADIRKGLLKQYTQLPDLDISQLINRNPVKINDTNTVVEMLNVIKRCPFSVMYLPVVDERNFTKGIVTFVNLIKSEL